MLYINGKKVDRMQNLLHAMYFECKNIKKAIIQYKKYTDLNDRDSIYLLDNYNDLYSVMIDSMQYRIVIGMGNVFDRDKKSLSFKKVLDVAQQEGISKLNSLIEEIKYNLDNYDDLKKNINDLRDKMYGHIEIGYSLENSDIFDKDFEFLNLLFQDSLEFLKYVMNSCVKISEKLNGDLLNLKINNMYEK